MTTVSSLEAISTLFSEFHDNFPVIIGKPSKDDVQCLLQRNFQSLQEINLGDTTNYTGLILSEVDHKAANENQALDCSDGALEAYNPSIQDDDNNALRLLQEKNWSRKLNRQAAIRTAERVENKFVLS